MQVIVFDDRKIENFYPITLTRSTGDLRVGILKLRQRILSFFDSDEINILVPEELRNLYKERHPDWNINDFREQETIFINSRLKLNDVLISKIDELIINQAIVYQDEIAAIKIDLRKKQLFNELQPFNNIKYTPIEFNEDPFWNHLWDFINENSEYIQHDFENYFYDKNNRFEMETGVTVLNPYNIWIGENVKIKPGIVLDASEGAIVIDEGVNIFPVFSNLLHLLFLKFC